MNKKTVVLLSAAAVAAVVVSRVRSSRESVAPQDSNDDTNVGLVDVPLPEEKQ